MDLSVVIPTYNGAQRLPAVLAHLREQVVPDDLQWEVIIVDNNSQDETAKIAQQAQSNWPSDVPLHYVFEPQQGSAFARQCGVNHAQGTLIGFLDDDNWPDENWVTAAWAFSETHPQAGAYASQIEGHFETLPPEALKPLLFYLALTQRGKEPMQYYPRVKGVPPSAGLVVRRQAWIANVPKQLFLVGRVGQSMLPGEDEEALLYLYQGGWEIWYNPEMKIQHCIPAARLQLPYLRRNLAGIGLSRHHLRMLSLPAWQRPLFFVLYLINDFRRVVSYYLKHRSNLYPQASSNPATVCKLALLWGTFVSPFYLMNVRFQRLLKQ